MSENEDAERIVAERQKIRERRERLWLLHKTGEGTVADLAREFGCSEQTIHNDWTRKDYWLPDLFDLRDVNGLSTRIIGEFEKITEECWSAIRKMRDQEAWHSYNGAVKNLKDTVSEEAQLLQSMGCLPKVAIQYAVENTAKTSEVKVNESESSVLNEAARILDKKSRSTEQSGNLH